MTRVLYWFWVCFMGVVFGISWAQPQETPEKKELLPLKKKLPVEIKVSVAASSRRMFRGNTWIPVRVELTNNSLQEEINGTLSIQVEHPKSSEIYETAVQVSQRPDEKSESPKKRFMVPVYFQEHSYVLRIRLLQPNKTTYEEFCDVTTFTAKDTYGAFLIISDESGHLEHLKTLEPLKTLLLLEYVSPRQLFSSKDLPWHLYDKIFIDRLTQYDLGAQFYGDLLQYVQQGGHLLVATGEAWKSVATEFPESLRPAQLSAFAEVSYTKEQETVPLVTMQANPDTESYFLPGMSDPYIVQKRLGVGSVSLLAMDLNTLKKLSPQFELLQTLPHDQHPMVVDSWYNAGEQNVLRDILVRRLSEDLSNSFKIKILEKSAVFLYLAIYLVAVCIVPVILFRLLDRLELAWGMIVVTSLIFFIAITSYQQQTKFRHFVGNVFTVTQLENQSTSARAVHFFAAYSPDYAEYDLQFGHEQESAYPVPLVLRDENSPKIGKKVWKNNTFFLEKTPFFANSKQTFEIQSFPKFTEPFDIQLNAPEQWRKQRRLEGTWKVPYSLRQGFLFIRSESNLNFFSLMALGAYDQPNVSQSFSLKIPYDFQGVSTITEKMRLIDPSLSPAQDQQVQEILELFLDSKNPIKVAFIGFRRESSLHFSVNESEPTLQKFTLVLADLTSSMESSSKKIFTPMVPTRKKMERESASASLRFQIENALLPLIDQPNSSVLTAELEVFYFPQVYPIPSLEGVLHLKKTYPLIQDFMPPDYVSFALQVEIWNPKTNHWHARPLFSSKNKKAVYYLNDYFWTAELPDLETFLDPENSSFRLRYTLSMTEGRTYHNLPLVSIQAFFKEKE